MNNNPRPASEEQETQAPALGRRQFLNYAGLTVATGALFLAGCKDDDDAPPPDTGLPPAGDTLTFTNSEKGILNLAYVLEQLSASFYIKVAESPAPGFSTVEGQFLTDIRDHEIAHRELFKAELGADAVAEVVPDFSSVNFSDRSSVLAAARTLKDLSVSAYNGAGEYLENADYLLLAGKIVSVEARHAALIRELRQSGSFAGPDAVSANGLDLSRKPSQVIALADPFIRNPIATLPSSWF